MSELLGIREKLDGTGAMIVRLERELSGRPSDKTLVLGLKSLEKRQQELQSEFAEIAAEMGADVCRYRFLPEDGNVKMASLASALLDYQLLFSVVYDAVTTGLPRQTTRLSAETQAKTALDYGYSFVGSVGFALTVPNRRLIGMETELDQAFKLISELVRATKPEEVKDFARRVGRGSIRALYRWADDHVKAQLNAEIEWGRGTRVQSRLLVQIPELTVLTSAINQTSDEERVEIKVIGILQGADVSNKTFHLDTDDGLTIRGTFSHTIDPSHPVELPKRYRATVVCTKIIFYSTEEERTTYELTSLEPIVPLLTS